MEESSDQHVLDYKLFNDLKNYGFDVDDFSDKKKLEKVGSDESFSMELRERVLIRLEALLSPGLERAASAIFARGIIAEGEVRWSKALLFYERASKLDPENKEYQAALEALRKEMTPTDQ